MVILLILVLIGAWLSGAISISINYILLRPYTVNVLIAILSTGNLIQHKED
ncbi:hypothetical protein [Clostridium botulinum]|uniref:hypothetical protein n=1 Tax=Clostridium botulinum TaxID=1491 RepID=UPI0013159BE2|nr:hypothetical protein [Clostridium botulinum]